jgi:hypothetical protein
MVFTVGAEAYSGADLILAAQSWQDWAALEQRTREGIACAKHARATREPRATAAVEAAADRFRAERGLHAAEDAENWLRGRRVRFTAWMQYFRRWLLRQEWASSLPRLLTEYAISPDQVNRNLRIEGMCSGYLAALARKLAGRAAVYERCRTEAANGSEVGPPQEAGMGAVAPEVCLVSGLLGLSSEEVRQKRERLTTLDQSLMQFRSQVITEENLKRKTSAYQVDWIQIQTISASFADESAAREAALCVREDGESLHSVATRARAASQPEQLELGKLDADAQAAFLRARVGGLIGPFRAGRELKLYQVLDKCIPSADNPEIKARAELLLLQAALQREVEARVHWLVPWWADSAHDPSSSSFPDEGFGS